MFDQEISVADIKAKSEKTPYFGEMSARMRSYREELLDAKPQVCTERAVITTETYRANLDQPLAIRRALMYKNVLSKMSIFIEKQTLLAGNHASSNRSAPIFPEYSMDWVIRELDKFDKRPGDRFYLSEEAKAKIREIAPFWENNTIRDRGMANMPEATRKIYELGLIQAEGVLSSGDAHIAIDYKRVLEAGLKEYRNRAEQKLSRLDLTDHKNLAKSYFYRAVIIVLDATRDFALRYAKLASEMAQTEKDGKRRAELEEMSRILNKVPFEKAESFHEAMQSLWLVHLCLQIESNGHSLSYGRIDQYINPFYEKDLAAGKISKEDACELFVNLWLKTISINKIRPWVHTEFTAGSPLYQNATIGGQLLDQDGNPRDATNPVSYLVLRSVAQVKLPQPNLTVRYNRNAPDAFMSECIEVIRLGFGMPAFNSDEVIIPSFMEKGVKKEDAYDYSAIGCVEVAVPGKWGYRPTGMSFLNFPKTLLIAMNDGVDPKSGERLPSSYGTPLPSIKHFRDMQSFEEVMDAWDRTIRDMTRHSIIVDTCADIAHEQLNADILCSALCDDCIERGLNLKEGGAVYDFISGLQVGIANLADSLSAIKKCVFEDKTIGAAELWDALAADFNGKRNEEIRELLISAPKYGNDDDYVDFLLRRAYDIYIDELKKYPNTRYQRGPIGGVYYAGTSTVSANVPQGASTLATPDGRKSGVPLAEGCSPSHAVDKNGPTAVLKSVSKLPTREITGGVLLNQKLNPQILQKEEDRKKLISLVRTFFDRLEGFHIQFNVVSRATLLEAQLHPEKHRDLVVRVAGYSAFFNVLSKATQDDIIGRTEQVL